MNFRFLKFMIPVIAIVLATLIAVAIQCTGKSDAPVIGYIEGSTPPCSMGIQCSENVGEICTIMIADTLRQAFGKNSPFPTDCTKVLYKP